MNKMTQSYDCIIVVACRTREDERVFDLHWNTIYGMNLIW